VGRGAQVDVAGVAALTVIPDFPQACDTPAPGSGPPGTGVLP
jgi:hypothetical protein